MTRKWLGCLALAVAWTVSAAAMDDPEPAKKATTGYVVEKPITPNNIKIPAGTPDELEKFMSQSSINRILRENGLDQEEAACFTAFAKMLAAEKIYADPKSTVRQKTSLRQNAVQAVHALLRLDSEKYRPVFDQYVERIAKSDPNSQAAYFGRAQQFRRDSKMDENEPSADLPKRMIDFAKKYPTNPFAKQYLDRVAKQLERKRSPEAVELFRTALELFPNDLSANSWRGAVTRLELPGKSMEIVGPKLDGKPFDIAQFKGKVVLVHFWASFSGQCNRELPVLKAVYAKLNGSGFEIVGVSLDRNRDNADRFVKERQIPWTQIYFNEYRQTGWDNPIAKKYAIASVPTNFIIGRDGKVTTHRFEDEATLETAIQLELRK